MPPWTLKTTTVTLSIVARLDNWSEKKGWCSKRMTDEMLGTPGCLLETLTAPETNSLKQTGDPELYLNLEDWHLSWQPTIIREMETPASNISHNDRDNLVQVCNLSIWSTKRLDSSRALRLFCCKVLEWDGANETASKAICTTSPRTRVPWHETSVDKIRYYFSKFNIYLKSFQICIIKTHWSPR